MNEHQAAVAHETSGFLANMIMQQRESLPEETVETRFGAITLSADKEITFGKGLLGMPETTRFCLLDMPSMKWSQFKLLQSVEEHSLSFILLPLSLDNPIVERVDLENASKDLMIPVSDLAVYLVISVHRDGSKVRLSANARAPIFANTVAKTAEQYVLRNTRYQVRHMISAQK